jgi:hypothetical protein
MSVGDPVVILIPVLRRPHRVAPLMASIAEATPEPHRALFIVERLDTEERRAIDVAGAEHVIVERPQRTYARKINVGYRSSVEPLLFLAADDLAFRPGWLPAARVHLCGLVQVVGTNDLLNPRVLAGEHATHSLVTRAYCDEFGTIDEPGKVLHEGYGHDYVDDEFVATARSRGAWAHAGDSVVEHLHPWAGKAPSDSTYRLGRAKSAAGRRLFQARRHLWAAA